MGIYRSTDPTVFDDVDGIVINESAPAPNVRGVAANIALLVGQFQRGPSTLTEVGSIGELQEIYGKSSYSGNLQLKNKKFGRLRIIRALASDAAKATRTFQSSATDIISFTAKHEGAYGNSISVTIGDADDDVTALPEIWSLGAVADTAGSLDGTYFILADDVGSVAFWFDNGDSGTTEPVHGADRSVEINTVNDGDSATVIAGLIQTAVDADSKFSASVATSTVTITSSTDGDKSGESAGTSGFTLTVSQEGATGNEAGVTYTIADGNTDAVLSTEVYKNIKIAEITAATFAGSQLVDVVVEATSAEPDNAAATTLAAGSDGTIADTDYQTALLEAEQENAGNILFLDEYNSIRNGYLKTHVATTQDKMCIVCGLEDDSVATAIADVANYRDTEGRIIYAYPWLETVINGAPAFVPPASFYASLVSQTSPHIDPAYTNNSGFLAGVTSLKRTLTRANYINLKDRGISAFELDSDVGFKIKSGIVTQINNSSKVTVLRRRMADFLTNSSASFLKNYQNEVNSAANRNLVKAAFLDFIQRQEIAGILPTDAEVTSGTAKLVDTESLNTDSSIALGFFKILWKQRIFSSMRYIVLQAEIGESVVVTEGE